MSKDHDMDLMHQDVVYAIAASPNFATDGICFAARSSGLYRSQDGGVTWQSTLDSLQLSAPLAASAVAVSPAFTADRFVVAGAEGGVLRSFDRGDAWYVHLLPAPPPLISCLAASPNFVEDGVLFAGALEDGVFRSANSGDNWVLWNFGLLDLHVMALAVSPDYARDETLFAGTETGVFRSSNGGRAWRETPFPADLAPVLSLALSPAFASDGVLFAGAEVNGLHVSRDRGRSWQRLGAQIAAESVNAIILSPHFPARPHLLVLLANGPFLSRDGGLTWALAAGPDVAGAQASAVAAPLGLEPGAPLLLGLTNGDVVRTTIS